MRCHIVVLPARPGGWRVMVGGTAEMVGLVGYQELVGLVG